MDLMRKDGRDDPQVHYRAKRIKQERDRHEQYKAQYEAYVEKKIEKPAGPRKKKAGRKKGRREVIVYWRGLHNRTVLECARALS